MSTRHSKKRWHDLNTVLGLLVGLGLLANQGFAAGAATVAIASVRPDKILYVYNEDATAAITLTNLTSQVQKGKMTAREEWDMEESRVLPESTFKLQPNESKVIALKWNVGDMPFGRGLRVALEQGKKEVAQKTEFYQVADPKDWFHCFLINYDENAYGNYHNHFNYAQCNFTHLAPETNQWVSQGNIQKDKMIQDIQAARQKGIRSGAYTICMGTGPAAWETARQHPEWFVKNAKGAFFDQANWWPLDPVKIAAGIWGSGGPVYPDMSNPEVVQFGGDQIVRAVKMFAFDAFFFDGIYGILNHNFDPSGKLIYTWDQKVYNTPEQVQKGSVAVARKTREIIRAAYPDIALWYNGTFPSPGNILNDASRESLKDGNCGLLVEVQGKFLNSPNFPTVHQWRNLYESLVNVRNSIIKEWKELNDPVMATGYLYNMNMTDIMTKDELAATRGTWTPCNHIGAIIAATRFHPCLSGEKGWRPISQFMTRYSALLWSRDVKCLPNPGRRISVDSNREVWWEECVYTRQYKGYQDTLVHIINAPEKEEVDFKVSHDPAPAKLVEVGYECAKGNQRELTGQSSTAKG